MMNRKGIFLSAIILALMGQTAFSADLDNNGIEDSYEQALAEKFCPSLQFHSGDQGVSPEPVEIMDINSMNLWVRVFNELGQYVYEKQVHDNFDPPISYYYPWLETGNYSYIDGDVYVYTGRPPGLAYARYYLAFHYEWAGQVNNSAGWYNAYADEATNNYYHDTIYAHLFKDEQTDKYVIQYWFFYPFNDYINNHEGDWEHINVVVTDQNPENAQIEKVVYYFHHFYRPMSPYWYVVDGTHPVVFVGGHGYVEHIGGGNGSHGSYLYPGHWLKTGEEIPMVGRPDEYVDGAGRHIEHN